MGGIRKHLLVLLREFEVELRSYRKISDHDCAGFRSIVKYESHVKLDKNLYTIIEFKSQEISFEINCLFCFFAYCDPEVNLQYKTKVEIKSKISFQASIPIFLQGAGNFTLK